MYRSICMFRWYNRIGYHFGYIRSDDDDNDNKYSLMKLQYNIIKILLLIRLV